MNRPVKFGLAVLGAGALLMGGAAAYAQIPAADGTITGCVNKASGVVRIIDTAKTSCSRTLESPLVWNASGVPGTPGTDGTDGVSGVHTVIDRVALTEGMERLGSVVACPEGEVALGGGVIAPTGDHTWLVAANTAVGDDIFTDTVSDHWLAVVQSIDGGASAGDAANRSMTVRVVCATAN